MGKTEQWRQVVGWPEYAVSDRGRLFSIRRQQVIRPWLKKSGSDRGYLVIDLQAERAGGYRGRRRYMVHRLVLEAFRGRRVEEKQCRHLDSNLRNNELSNLEWGTYRENLGDRRMMRRHMVLSEEQVRYIRGSGKSLRVLARELGCGKSQVGNVRNGVSWKDIL